MKPNFEEVDEAEVMQFKKKLAKLRTYQGRGTELISLYLPADVDRSSVMGQITEETSQSSNIKSPTTRKNVQGALRKINNFLKQIDFKLPKHGLGVFCGNISEVEGKSDIQLMTLRPPMELKVKLYRCDSKFFLEPMDKMVKPNEIYALATIDKNEATIALLSGKKYEILGHFTSGVAGKSRAGGQCLAPESLIQLSNGEIIEISQAHNPLNVKSANFENYSIENSGITNAWESDKSGVKIITKFPRTEIICSKDHRVFVMGNSIKEKRAGELKEDDLLIMPEKIKTHGQKQKIGNLYFNSYKISRKGCQYLINKRQKLKLSQKQLGKINKIHQAVISGLERGTFNPRLDYLKKYCKSLELQYEKFILKYCKPQSKLKLPKTLENDLAEFLGYFIGDGSFENERITLFEEHKTVAKKYEKLAKQIFNAKTSLKFRKDKNYYQVRIYGKPIVRFLKTEFPEIGKARDSRIPSKILKSKNKEVGAFIRGLFDAEGYVTENRLAIGLNNKKFIQQLQITLLRFGIMASVHVYDNRKNAYSNNYRFTLDITEKESLKKFNKYIGTGVPHKTKKLSALCSKKQYKSKVRQILIPGKKIRLMFEKEGFNTEDFPKVSDFFRDKKNMSKKVFRTSIMNKVKTNKKLYNRFKGIVDIPLLPVAISKITPIKKMKMYDIEVSKNNFLANSLFVHNSAKRFEHLREEAAQEFYKRISEKINEIFLKNADKLKGLIIGGPGMTKTFFLNKDLIDHRLKNKLIGTVDTAYTDDSGIREMVNKSEKLLKDTDIMREKSIINSFMESVVKNDLGVYGKKETEEAVMLGKVDTLLISEDLGWMVYRYVCTACGEEKEITTKKPKEFDHNAVKCEKCNSEVELLEEVDYIDHMIEKAQQTDSKIKLISTDTAEGEQFLTGFGGIGAILRYK